MTQIVTYSAPTSKTTDRSPYSPDQTSPRSGRRWGLWDSVQSVARHLKAGCAPWSWGLEFTEPAIAVFLPADIQNADELEFDETDVIEMFKNNNYHVHMCQNHIEYIATGGQRLMYQPWPEHGLDIVLTSDTVRLYLTHTDHSFQVNIQQTCRGFRNSLLFCLGGSTMRRRPARCRRQTSSDATFQNFLHIQVC